MQSRITLSAAAIVCIACAQAAAQSSALSNADESFMRLAAQDNMTEAHLGEMAESQAADSALKTFAHTLVQDHTKAYEELSALSGTTGGDIPKGIDVRKDAAIQQLGKLKGASFDRRFLQNEIRDHEKAISAFKREAEHGQNSDVKGYAQKVVPTLEEHLHKAQEIARTEQHS
jgi:putative membrane protein